MKLMNCPAVWMLAALTLSPALLRAQDGSDVNEAIPIYFGQKVSDILAAGAKPFQIYSIILAKGQTLSVSASGKGVSNNGWCIGLYSPKTLTLADLYARNCDQVNNNSRLAWSGFYEAGLGFVYTVPAPGRYYIGVLTYNASTTFTLQATATGTPLTVPNPDTAGCLTGQVDSITYSLQLIAAGLPDEVIVGGVKACAGCAVKPPLYPEISNRLESALKSGTNVEACYDASGNIFQLKLSRP